MTPAFIQGVPVSRNGRNIRNFGANIRFRPETYCRPTGEDEVLALLERYDGHRLRAIGALHSWSPCAAGDDVVLDLRRLNRVAVERDAAGGARVTVGAGCRIRRLLRVLRREGLTLPAVGLIDAQSVAGAIATGTHGSGRSSLSHYVLGVRAAAYDPDTGRPVVREWTGGDALRAARCGLGCTGIVLTATLPCVPVHNVEEYTARHASLDDILGLAAAYPLQQAYLVPWLWGWYAHHRRETGAPASAWALPYRLYRGLAIDYVFHALVRLLANVLRSPRTLRGFYRRVFPRLMLTGTRSIDRMDRILLMRHQAFRHVETELFVPEPAVREAMEFVRAFLVHAAGVADGNDPVFDRLVHEHGLESGLDELRGRYTHHFPITLRRVLPDETMISMASGRDTAWWAISLITYRTGDLAGFQAAMAWLAPAMAKRYGARPHWGKHCPLDQASLEGLYPELPRFRQFCLDLDPDGRFRNEFANDKLGFRTEGGGS